MTNEDNNISQYRHRRKAERDSVFAQLDGYDPMAFYLGSTNKHDHDKDGPRFRLPPAILSMIGNVVASRMFPYLNPGQLVRDAIIHHCQWLSEQTMDPDIQREMMRTLAAENVQIIERRVMADLELVERSRAAADIVIRSKDWSSVAGLASSLADCVDGLTEPYSTQILALVADMRSALPESWKQRFDEVHADES